MAYIVVSAHVHGSACAGHQVATSGLTPPRYRCWHWLPALAQDMSSAWMCHLPKVHPPDEVSLMRSQELICVLVCDERIFSLDVFWDKEI